MKVFIYAIKSGSDVLYVGASFNVDRRFKQHLSSTFKAFVNKDSLYTEIIEMCKRSEVKERELFWIKHYKENNVGMLNKIESGHSGKPEKETESVRIEKDVVQKARKYISGTPMTIGGWISSELRNVLNKVAPISKPSKKK